MTLREALARLQATLHRERPYVLAQGGWLTSTDSHHWMTTEVENLPDFCVSHQALATALKLHPEAEVYSDDEGGVLVKARSARTRVRSVMSEYVPLPVVEEELLRVELPQQFRDILKTLLEWIDDPTMTTGWMQGIHITDNYMFVANRHEAAVAPGGCPEIAGETDFVTIPQWAAKTIANAKSLPMALIEYDRGIGVVFADGSRLHSLKLQEKIPTGIVKFVRTEILDAAIDTPVPPALRKALDVFTAHKASKMMLGLDRATLDTAESQTLDIDITEVGVPGPIRSWKIANMARAMDCMDFMEIDDGKWRWRGPLYTGIFMGLAT